MVKMKKNLQRIVIKRNMIRIKLKNCFKSNHNTNDDSGKKAEENYLLKPTLKLMIYKYWKIISNPSI
jgi:hypothetical protein